MAPALTLVGLCVRLRPGMVGVRASARAGMCKGGPLNAQSGVGLR